MQKSGERIMAKKAFDEIMAGIQDGIAFARGDDNRGTMHAVAVPETVDVKAVRTSLGLTQKGFAALYGFDPRALQDWEQGRRHPHRTARILIMIIERKPDIVHAVLADDNIKVVGPTAVRAAHIAFQQRDNKIHHVAKKTRARIKIPRTA
jgi:putative transcriptional regulator